ncbi:MAG TPA: response regulator [Tepidisphaeraceae bacterium]|jgi:CheY-like chemotaxis protein|nr:response regulator [Tepidisphaeraceae bacterium]
MSTILIVEDDSDTREVMARYLTLAGYEHRSVSNGWEALLAVDQNQIDLILLDVMMPGMDGVTFLNILRNAQTKRNTPVVIVTAMSKQELSSRYNDLPVQAVLPKTQELFDELMQTVHNILKKPEPGQRPPESAKSEVARGN